MKLVPLVLAVLSLADTVNPFMGTNNEGPGYSRGNQYPGIHVPFGMAAWSVGTAGLQDSWFYDYKDGAITGIKLTHQPTVWGGDFGAFDLMPMTGGMSADYEQRKSAYSRANEVAHPYYYRNVLTRYGVTFELAPSERGGIFRFSYPRGSVPQLAIGGAGGERKATVAVAEAVAGATLADAQTLEGRFSNGGVTTYYSATFDRPARLVRVPGLAAGLEFPARSDDNTVVMKIATSYIGIAQARDNLALELERHSLESLAAEAKARWDEDLGRIEVQGGTEDQRATFYSALYRVFAFPKTHWEPVGRDATRAQYLSPFDGKVHAGKLWTGNGFWDTYRAVWPLFALLFPARAGAMLDGWVNSYKDGGWTVRWSKPGYWECMIGTHTDVIFADAFVKGVRNFDYRTAYEASLKNALVAGGHGGKGRRFLERSAYLGYVPWTGQSPDDEVGARTLEDAVNDFGISQLAQALGKPEDAAYFRNRALGYASLWSPSVRFFRGKDDRGRWRTTDAAFDPFAWRYEWTEGNAWHYRAAPVFDGAGLAALFGGPRELERGLDEIFAASPRFEVGGYGAVIHEMLEAQAAGEKGFGQFAIGNEPDHHMPHMYAYAGRPSKTQYWTRRALAELFESGVGTGYGYPGDEDNGQMSAWYVLNALGLYPSPGRPEYLLTSPLFERVALHLENGKTFEIQARGNDARHVYIGDAALNGAPYTKTFLTQDDLTRGGRLELAMSEAPTAWGERAEDRPSSLTAAGEMPRYRPNLAAGAVVTGSAENPPRETLAKLVDGDGRTKWLAFARQATVVVRLAKAEAVDTYTLTSANDAPERDPKAWKLYGSNDGKGWTLIDERKDVVWRDRAEIKPFYVSNARAYSQYRLEITENGGSSEVQLAELELRSLGLTRAR